MDGPKQPIEDITFAELLDWHSIHEANTAKGLRHLATNLPSEHAERYLASAAACDAVAARWKARAERERTPSERVLGERVHPIEQD